jgi:hypothetical protein
MEHEQYLPKRSINILQAINSMKITPCKEDTSTDISISPTINEETINITTVKRRTSKKIKTQLSLPLDDSKRSNIIKNLRKSTPSMINYKYIF